MSTSQSRLHCLSTIPFLATLAACCLLPAPLIAQRSTVAARALTNANATDTGAIPSSQPLTITLRLAPTADRAAALDQLLTSQITAGSSSYHQWLTPEQYAASYGATDDQLTTITTWAQSQGLTVSTISAGKTRMTLTGSVDAVQRAFATTLHSYAISGNARFAPATTPSVPLSVAPMIAAVSGLDNLPSLLQPASPPPRCKADHAALHTDIRPTRHHRLRHRRQHRSNAHPQPKHLHRRPRPVRRRRLPSPLPPGERTGHHDPRHRQLHHSRCLHSQPSLMLGLPEVTALTVAPDASLDSTLNLTEARPGWQVAPGLPPTNSVTSPTSPPPLPPPSARPSPASSPQPAAARATSTPPSTRLPPRRSLHPTRRRSARHMGAINRPRHGRPHRPGQGLPPCHRTPPPPPP